MLVEAVSVHSCTPQGCWMQLAANTAERPWFGSVRDAVTTPLRALPYVVGGAGLYAIGLTGLSRLLAEPATDAGW